jgi:GT2 family glycosyltransferase/glycosyltransferase involved in cell wall biosynthesis
MTFEQNGHTGAQSGDSSRIPLLVVIVNYRTPELTISCVESLRSAVEELPGMQAVIVDNGSEDGSMEQLQAALEGPAFDGWTKLVEVGENLGFSGGCNRGWREGPEAEYVLLLNSDARLNEGAISYCVEKMRRETDIGAMSCRLDNEDGSIQNVTRRFPTPYRLLATSSGLSRRFPKLFPGADLEDLGWDRATTARDVDWIGGAFLMLRGDLIALVGLLDEDFFFYGEDVEICHRVWKNGFRCHYDPAVTTLHLGGRSPSRKGSVDHWRAQQLWSARYVIQRKCHGRLAELAVRIPEITILAIRAVRRRMQFGRESDEASLARTVLRTAMGRPQPNVGPNSNSKASKRLRVLIALPGLHRVERGAEIAFENLARHLSRRSDCAVTLIGSGTADPRTPYKALQAGCIDREFFRHFPKLPPMRDGFRYEELSFLPGLWRKYQPQDYDVTVTCSFPFVQWALRGKGKEGQRPPHVFVTQNGDWPARKTNYEYRSFECDGLVCTNPEYQERHGSNWNSRLIPNGVDLDTFYPGAGDREALGLPLGVPLVLVVSSLTPNKRVLEAVQALASDEKIHLVVAGRGPQKEELLALGAEQMPGRFHHVELSPDSMGELYRSADLLLHMSQTEPFGNIYPEAAASGLPIVADDNDRTGWILEGHGHLVDTGDLPSVLRTVRSALASHDAEAAVRMRQLAERRFGWESVADQYYTFLKSVAMGEDAGNRAAVVEFPSPAAKAEGSL